VTLGSRSPTCTGPGKGCGPSRPSSARAQRRSARNSDGTWSPTAIGTGCSLRIGWLRSTAAGSVPARAHATRCYGNSYRTSSTRSAAWNRSADPCLWSSPTAPVGTPCKSRSIKRFTDPTSVDAGGICHGRPSAVAGTIKMSLASVKGPPCFPGGPFKLAGDIKTQRHTDSRRRQPLVDMTMVDDRRAEVTERAFRAIGRVT
jgi:hypothetical protein